MKARRRIVSCAYVFLNSKACISISVANNRLALPDAGRSIGENNMSSHNRRVRAHIPLLALAALAFHAADASAQNPASVGIPGNYQSEAGCAGDWDPGCARRLTRYARTLGFGRSSHFSALEHQLLQLDASAFCGLTSQQCRKSPRSRL